MATHLAQMLRESDREVGCVVSTHHTLFFNVLSNALKSAKTYYLGLTDSVGVLSLRSTGDAPMFHHVATLAELHEAARSGNLYAHHFNALRTVLEKTASFHGYTRFSACIGSSDLDSAEYARMLNVLSHGHYSMFEPREMPDDNKRRFRALLRAFMRNHAFNPELFPE